MAKPRNSGGGNNKNTNPAQNQNQNQNQGRKGPKDKAAPKTPDTPDQTTDNTSTTVHPAPESAYDVVPPLNRPDTEGTDADPQAEVRTLYIYHRGWITDLIAD